MRIQIRDNAMPPYEIELDSFGKDVVSFGKQPDNDIVLKSAYASRIHGCFYKENGVTYIEDMNSTNGLKINGNKIKKAPMKVGESVEINVGNYGQGVVFTCVAENYGGMYDAPPMPATPPMPVYNYNYQQQQPNPSGGNIKCPNCGSNNLQVLQEQYTKGKDFKGGNACCGAIIFGPIGLLCGSCGKGKQLKTNHFWLCNNCGYKFKI